MYPAREMATESFVSRGHNSPDYAVGEVVPVLYTADIPRRAAIDEFALLWSTFGLLTILGGCLLGTGACNLWITAAPARAKIRTAVSVRELKEAFRAGRLTRDSEYQGLLVAFSFVGFAVLGLSVAVVVFASATMKMIITALLLYTLVQIVRGRQSRRRGRRA